MSLLVSTAWKECLGAEAIEGICAIVNGEIITRKAVREACYPEIIKAKKQLSGEALVHRIEQLMQKTRQELVEEYLLAQEAKRVLDEKRKRQVEDTLDSLIKKIISDTGSLLEVKEKLKKAGTSLEEMKEQQRRALLARQLLEMRYGSSALPSVEDVRRYYREHEADYVHPARCTILQILVKFSEYDTKEQALSVAKKVRAKLKAGADFHALAKMYSQGPHASDGGEWKDIRPDALIPEIAAVIKKLQVGKTSDIIESSIGYHIVRVEKMRPARKIPFEEAQSEIRQKLYEQNLERMRKRLVKKLARQSRIVLETPFLLTKRGDLLPYNPENDASNQ